MIDHVAVYILALAVLVNSFAVIRNSRSIRRIFKNLSTIAEAQVVLGDWLEKTK
jgi:uncharacterized protein YerC